jgi:hypothetical protein
VRRQHYCCRENSCIERDHLAQFASYNITRFPMMDSLLPPPTRHVPRP